MDDPLRIKDGSPNQAQVKGLQQSAWAADILEQYMGFVRRQYLVFSIIVPCALVLGFAYLLTASPLFTAKAMLLIDSNKVHVLQPQQQALGDAPLDTAQVETQVEILKSEKIARSVVNDLHLTEDPEFIQTGGGLFSTLLHFVSFGVLGGESEADPIRTAIQTLLGHRTVTRVGRTYAIDIGYTSRRPDRAATIANAIADAYILDQLQSKYQATRRASDWLRDRIKELQTQALSSDRAVLEYKQKNNIVDIGGDAGAGGSGRLIGEQQLADLNTQFTTARVATGEAKARWERIDHIMTQNVPDATITDSLRNEVITRIRNQYLDLAAREADWSKRYGPNHEAAVNARNQMAELSRSIRDELARIAAGYKSDYEIAKTREESLERKVAGLIAEGQLTNRDRLGLNELESNAKANHTIYDNFLQRYMEAIQQESFPITEARIVSPAAPPERKSSPIGALVMVTAGLLGAVASVGVATLREVFDFVFRTTRQVEEALRTPCLSVLPRMKPSASSGAKRDMARQATQQKSVTKKRAPDRRGDLALATDTPGDMVVAVTDNSMRYAIEAPFSAFAESLRSIKIAAELQAAIRKNKVIGVTSTLPDEGKSTVACNLAELMADAGKRVILVDADLRKPKLTASLEPKPVVGLLEVLGGKADLQQVVRVDAETGLSFLPSLIDTHLVHSDEVLASEALGKLIEQLRERYDYVIVDLPPLGPVVDVRAATKIIDSFIFVVEWGRTRIGVVQRRLKSAPEVHDLLLGVVLNKADAGILRRYERHYGNSYGNQSYGAYGRYGYSQG